MKYIKTFENYSVNEEEGLGKRIMQGSKKIDLSEKNFEDLKKKYAIIVDKDGKILMKPSKDAIFTLGGDVLKGDKRALNMKKSFIETFKMNEQDALCSVMGVYDWNGFCGIDNESEYKQGVSFIAIKSSGKESGGSFWGGGR